MLISLSPKRKEGAMDNEKDKLKSREVQKSPSNRSTASSGLFLTATGIITAVFLALIIFNIKLTFNLSKDVNKIPELIKKQNTQVKFEGLAKDTLNLVEKYYYPNLSFTERYVPDEMKIVIHDYEDKIKELILKEGAVPDETPAYYRLMGLLYCGKHPTKIADVDKARENFEKYLTLRPHDEEVRTNLALCYIYVKKRKQNYEKALETLEEALQYNPTYCRGHYNKALVLWHLERYEEAKRVINTLITKIDPNCPEGNFAMSLIQYQIEKKNKVLTKTIYYLNRAVDLGFDDISWLGTSSFLDDNFRKTKHFYNAALRIAERRNLPKEYYPDPRDISIQ